MAKKPQNTAGNRNEDSAPQGSKWPDKAIIRYINAIHFLLIGTNLIADILSTEFPKISFN